MSIVESSSVLEICARIKHLGYAKSGRVRLYGEEFEVVSDPCQEQKKPKGSGPASSSNCSSGCEGTKPRKSSLKILWAFPIFAHAAITGNFIGS
jgi:hypothetical protein